ncbi:putative racemase YgeA [Nymphon striatum]|nr:putative racemase YgeA [Nymphon striatum]
MRRLNKTLVDYIPPRLFYTSVDFAEIEKLQHEGKWDETAEILKSAAQGLEKAGADFILICTNTMHLVAPEVEASIGIPLLHIADATAEEITKQGIKKIGLLGTAFTMEQDFYKGRLTNEFNLEMFLWDKPMGRRAFGLTQEFASQTKAMAANQGLYNGFLVAGLVWGLILGESGHSIVIFFLSCVIVAGVFGAITFLSHHGGGAKQSVRVSNESNKPIAVQFSVTTRQQINNKEVRKPADKDFMIYPPQTIIPANSTQRVRVEWLGAGKLPREQAYRLIAEQVYVSLDEQNQTGVKMLMTLVGALYVQPNGTRSNLSVKSVQRQGNKLAVTVANSGNKHQLMRYATLVLRNGGQAIHLKGKQLSGLEAEEITDAEIAAFYHQLVSDEKPSLTPPKKHLPKKKQKTVPSTASRKPQNASYADKKQQKLSQIATLKSDDDLNRNDPALIAFYESLNIKEDVPEVQKVAVQHKRATASTTDESIYDKAVTNLADKLYIDIDNKSNDTPPLLANKLLKTPAKVEIMSSTRAVSTTDTEESSLPVSQSTNKTALLNQGVTFGKKTASAPKEVLSELRVNKSSVGELKLFSNDQSVIDQVETKPLLELLKDVLKEHVYTRVNEKLKNQKKTLFSDLSQMGIDAEYSSTNLSLDLTIKNEFRKPNILSMNRKKKASVRSENKIKASDISAFANIYTNVGFNSENNSKADFKNEA